MKSLYDTIQAFLIYLGKYFHEIHSVGFLEAVS